MNPVQPRRTLTEAVSAPKLSPEAVALIKEGTPKPQTSNTLTVSTIATPLQAVAVAKPIRETQEPARSRNQKPVQADGACVGIYFRLPPSIPAALLKASSDRKLNKVEPYTQQAIVAEALTKWLRENGYLPKEG